MRIQFDKSRKSATISNCIVVFFGILVYFLFARADVIFGKISWFLSLLNPFFIGFFLAYFLNPLVYFFETKVLKFLDTGGERQKLRRGVSILICLMITVFFFSFLLFMFIPRLIDSIVLLFNNFPDYVEKLTEFINGVLTRYHIDSKYIQSIALTSDRIAQMFSAAFQNILPAIVDYSAKIASVIGNLLVGMVISIYFLYGKEHFMAQAKKLIYAFFPLSNADRIIEVSQMIHRTFINFIIGKAMDSLIVGLLCLIAFNILDMPQALLLAVIIGVSNIIPFFGPYIGAFFGSVLVLLTAPGKILWFWGFVFVIQQLDANLIDPKISGKSTGVAPVWVILAILLGGGMFGPIGLLLGVPVFAVFFILFKAYIDKRLEKKKMPVKTAEYQRAGKIETVDIGEEDEI